MAIVGFLAGVSPVMHDFWRDQDPVTRNTNMIMFMKNLALAGAALALLGVEEPWEASLRPRKPNLSDQMRRIGRRIAAQRRRIAGSKPCTREPHLRRS